MVNDFVSILESKDIRFLNRLRQRKMRDVDFVDGKRLSNTSDGLWPRTALSSLCTPLSYSGDSVVRVPRNPVSPGSNQLQYFYFLANCLQKINMRSSTITVDVTKPDCRDALASIG